MITEPASNLRTLTAKVNPSDRKKGTGVYRKGPKAMPETAIGKRIREIRKRRLRMTQAELATALGVSRPETVSDWERGATPNPPRERLEDIAQLAGMTYEDAFGAITATGGVGEVQPEHSAGAQGELAEAEEWLSRIVSPEMRARWVGTPAYRDNLLGASDIVSRRNWPPERKVAVQALIYRLLEDDGGAGG